MKKHLWFGKRITDLELEGIIETDSHWVTASPGFDCERLIKSISNWSRNIEESIDISPSFLKDLKKFCDVVELKKKIVRELGGIEKLSMRRVDFEGTYFERRSPLGVLLHVLPGNSEGLSFLAAIEGLLVGNINIVKLSQTESNLTIELCESLIRADSSGFIASRMSFLRISSSSPVLDKLLKLSQGVSAWGGDTALSAIRLKTSPQSSFITWGHKISFALVSSNGNSPENLEKIAFDIIDLNQQACSSPQMVFFECEDEKQLKSFGETLLPYLAQASKLKGELSLDIMERAELQNESLIYQFLDSQGEGFILSENDVRIYGKMNCELVPSPLNRTIHLRPVEKSSLVKTLFNWREYLQTCGLACIEKTDFLEWSKILLDSGVSRICLPGKMVDSYSGEPHDGQFALERFSKTVRLELPQGEFNNTLFTSPVDLTEKNLEFMSKDDFQTQSDNGMAHLYFKSGGSSGSPKISRFSYSDYSSQMQAAADGLIAGGFDPRYDRVVNLFFGGGLYGGFLSFTTILEKINAVQLPMGAVEDFEFLTSQIISMKINTLFGMPSYLYSYLLDQQEELKHYGGIRKIFYGGEHFSNGQRNWIKRTFDIVDIKSASYGSVDAGPIGFQCLNSSGGVHHLNDQLQFLEILKINENKKVEKGEVGRLVVTTPSRQAMRVERYDIGDLGRWVVEPCLCGSCSPRFELMGRIGDVFRAAGNFLNYKKFESILADLEFSGEFQLTIENNKVKEELTLYAAQGLDESIEFDTMTFINNIKELREAVIDEGTLLFRVELRESVGLERVKSSGKLRRVIDKREY